MIFWGLFFSFYPAGLVFFFVSFSEKNSAFIGVYVEGIKAGDLPVSVKVFDFEICQWMATPEYCQDRL